VLIEYNVKSHSNVYAALEFGILDESKRGGK
jgi:hypothetical protein